MIIFISHYYYHFYQPTVQNQKKYSKPNYIKQIFRIWEGETVMEELDKLCNSWTAWEMPVANDSFLFQMHNNDQSEDINLVAQRISAVLEPVEHTSLYLYESLWGRWKATWSSILILECDRFILLHVQNGTKLTNPLRCSMIHSWLLQKYMTTEKYVLKCTAALPNNCFTQGCIPNQCNEWSARGPNLKNKKGGSELMQPNQRYLFLFHSFFFHVKTWRQHYPQCKRQIWVSMGIWAKLPMSMNIIDVGMWLQLNAVLEARTGITQPVLV